jgi:hypothetical protein
MDVTGDDRLKLMGAPGSPYTRKMLALLRYRRIPYAVLWGGHQNPPQGLPQPKVKLLPTFYFPDGNGDVEAVVDSHPSPAGWNGTMLAGASFRKIRRSLS